MSEPAYDIIPQDVVERLELRPIQIQDRAQSLITAAANAEFNSPEEMAQGADLMKQIGAALKALDQERVSWVCPLNQQVARLNERFKGLMNPLKDGLEVVRARMGAFHAESDRKAREEAERARREQEEKALAEAKRLEDTATGLAAAGQMEEAALASEAAADVISEAIETPQPVAIAPQQHRGAYGATASQRETWHWRVLDINKVPPELITVKEKEINALVRAGRRDIPGIEIFPQKKMVAR